ncbi:MAG: OB-fold domain-containing protein [Ilumatobacteraceae bacterium]
MATTSDSAELHPITEGLFTWPSDAPQLIGSRCNRCGTVAFPFQGSCARCTATDATEHLLAREGTLWTWTVQGFRPKSPPYTGPADFEPFPVGYVELPGEVKVETRLVDVSPDGLTIGMPMELAIVPFPQESGDAVLTFAFRPAADPTGDHP